MGLAGSFLSHASLLTEPGRPIVAAREEVAVLMTVVSMLRASV
jgi:hypothetical protein